MVISAVYYGSSGMVEIEEREEERMGGWCLIKELAIRICETPFVSVRPFQFKLVQSNLTTLHNNKLSLNAIFVIIVSSF